MAATAQQIAAAKQLAQSRGYDPGLVDADNADRANTAFPTQGGGYSGGAGYHPPAGTPLAAPTVPGIGPAPATTPGAPGAGGMTPVGSTPSVDAINKVAIPGVEDMSNSLSMAAGAMGGGGAMGNQETNATASMSGLLRALGQHDPPEQSLKLQRRAY